MDSLTNRPVVMVFAGSDPTGGAGIAADILTLESLGCHAAPVVTAITVQDTVGIKEFSSVDTEMVIAQARAILEDMPVAAFKTGMLGNIANMSAIATLSKDYPDVPLIVDPVLTSGAGVELADEPMESAYRSLLLPQATLVTPNTLEAHQLAPEADTLGACASMIIAFGTRYVMITGTHETTIEVSNRFFDEGGLRETFTCERLPQSYHGSGCTLASACAATLAHGVREPEGFAHALRFSWQSLRHGHKPGMGQLLPHRLYWAYDTTPPDD